MNEKLTNCPFCRPTASCLKTLWPMPNRNHHHTLVYEWLLEQAKKLGIHGGSAFKTISGFGRPNILNYTIDTNPRLMQDEHEELFYNLDRTTTHHVNFH